RSMSCCGHLNCGNTGDLRRFYTAVMSQTGKMALSLRGALAVISQTGKMAISIHGALVVTSQTRKTALSIRGELAVISQTRKKALSIHGDCALNKIFSCSRLSTAQHMRQCKKINNRLIRLKKNCFVRF